MKTLVEGSYVVGFDGKQHEIIKDGVVVFNGDRIEYVGKEYSQPVDRNIDAKGCLVSPGLIDTHFHSGINASDYILNDSTKTDFFASAIVSISGLEERRVRSILATGRFHAVRALLEAAGLGRDLSTLFVDAIMQWRDLIQSTHGLDLDHIADRLIRRYRDQSDLSDAARGLLDVVERLAIAEERRLARDYASGIALAAA